MYLFTHLIILLYHLVKLIIILIFFTLETISSFTKFNHCSITLCRDNIMAYVHMYIPYISYHTSHFILCTYLLLYLCITISYSIEHLFQFCAPSQLLFVPTSVSVCVLLPKTIILHYVVPYPYVLTHLEGCHQLSNLTLN